MSYKGGLVCRCIANKRVMGFNPGLRSLCLETPCSCVSFLWELQPPPTVQKDDCLVAGDSKLLSGVSSWGIVVCRPNCSRFDFKDGMKRLIESSLLSLITIYKRQKCEVTPIPCLADMANIHTERYSHNEESTSSN